MQTFGRSKTAVEETICICKSEGVLKEYLESREKEVVDIMIILFGQGRKNALDRRKEDLYTIFA